jgi:hypothetical protein
MRQKKKKKTLQQVERPLVICIVDKGSGIDEEQDEKLKALMIVSEAWKLYVCLVNLKFSLHTI